MSGVTRKITMPVSIGYGLTDIMGGEAFTVMGAWLLFYYTTFAGLSPKRREGFFAAVMTFSRKTTLAIATFVIGLVLQFGGLIKGSQFQPQEAINTIAITLFAGTVGLLLLALWQAFTFHLNKRTHKIFVDEMERLKNHGFREDVTNESRAVVEDLTGLGYEEVWPVKVTDQ